MSKIKKKINVTLELYSADDLQDVKVHPMIESVMDNLNDGYKLFVASLKSAQLREITKTKPILLWDDGAGNLTVIGNVIYYYESLANNAAAYVQKCNMTEKRALYDAMEECRFGPISILSLLGPSLIKYIKIKDSVKTKKMRGLTKYHNKLYTEIFVHDDCLDKRVYTNELDKAKILATILHLSPETVCKQLDFLGIRPRKKQRNPRPPLNPQRKFNLVDENEID